MRSGPVSVRAVRLVTGLAAGVVLAAHVAAAVAQAGPVAVPDVPGYLAVAQWLAGGQPPPALGYHPGYGLLLAPVAMLGADPEQLHTAALVLNAAAAAAVVVVIATLMRTLRPDASWAALVTAVAVAALHPSVSVGARIAWPEALLVLAVVTTAWLLARLVVDPRRPPAIALGALAVVPIALHPRAGALAVGIVVAVLAEARARRHLLEVVAGALGGAVVVAAALAAAYQGPEGGGRLGDAVTASSGVERLVAAAGQLVALTVGTGGLAALAASAVAAAWLASRRRGASEGTAPPDEMASAPGGATAFSPAEAGASSAGGTAPRAAAWRAVGTFLVVSAVATAVVVAGPLGGSDRGDTVAYGRYLDPFAVGLAVVALTSGAVGRRRTRAHPTRLVVPLGALAGWMLVAALAGLGLDRVDRPGLRIMTLATDVWWWLADGDATSALGLMTAAGSVVLAAWVASSLGTRVATGLAVGATVVLLVVSTVTGQRHVGAVGEVAAGQVTAAATVAAELTGDEESARCLAHGRDAVPGYVLWLYRWSLPDFVHRRVSLDAGQEPCSPLVVASVRSDHRPACATRELLVDEPSGSWGLWRVEPGTCGGVGVAAPE